MSYTPEQQLAVFSKGRTIVSASAGSGKTFVMIEKLVKLILDDAEISELLAVTFTTKAATQMREKLKKAILEKLADPNTSETEKKKLGKKLSDLPSADISTIHSFLLRVLKRYFFLLNLPSEFGVLADDQEQASYHKKAMDKVFEEAYETEDEDFFRLLSVYRRYRSDQFLRDTILDFYKKVRPIAGYRELLSDPNFLSFDEVSSRYADYFIRRIRRREVLLRNYADSYPDLEKTGPFIDELLFWCEGVKGGYQNLRDMAMLKLPSKPRKNVIHDAVDQDVCEKIAEIRKDLSDLCKEFLKNGEYVEEQKKYESATALSRALVKFTLRFDEEYLAEKKKKAKFDYGDLEHFMLELLENDTVKEELKGRYRYVFIDEYQDVNPVQEAILSAISGENTFLVGDMKQSIYGFRGSKSIYFANKIKEFSKEGNALLLTKNFRSAPKILDFVNRIFSVCMKGEIGIDYASTSMMMSGAKYSENDGRVKLHLLPEEAVEEEIRVPEVYSVEKRYEKQVEEASILSKKVEEIIETELASKIFDLDTNTYRKVNYGDIAILVRDRGGLDEMVQYLSKKGIPVALPGQVDICLFTEVQSLIDWLRLIDNEEQDYPLISAMLSPMGGFSEDELAEIRLKNTGKNYRECVKNGAKKRGILAEKIGVFYEKLRRFRAYSRVHSAAEVLQKLISESAYETGLLAHPNGRQKIARVHRLLDECSGSIREFLTGLKANGGKILYTEASGENAVQIVTVHASKGLEYPVVILLSVTKPFHRPETDEVLFFDNLPAPRYYDIESMTKGQTLLRRLCTVTQKEESVKDEMNLFYVALTRAKYSLHLILEKRVSFDVSLVSEAKSWAEFFDPERFDIDESMPSVLPFTPAEALMDGEEGDEKPILTAMDFAYPYEKATTLPVKSSASAILEENAEYYLLPSLFGESDREKGTIYHKFLELVDFNAPLVEEMERLRPSFTAEEFERLEQVQLHKILSLPIFKRIQKGKISREQQFLCYLPDESGEPILYQGAIDLLSVGTRIEIVDYKMTGKDNREVVKHYRPQLLLYRDAVSKILKVDKRRIFLTIVNLMTAEELTISDEI